MISTSDPLTVIAIARKHDILCVPIGVTTKDKLVILNEDLSTQERTFPVGETGVWIDCSVERLNQTWEGGLQDLLEPQLVTLQES